MYKRLDSYEEVEKFWNTARFKDRGKPIGSWGRLFKRDDRFEFHVKHYSWNGGAWVREDYNSSNCFATLYPDNTIEFNLNLAMVRNYGQSLNCSMDNIIPFGIHRIAMMRYRIFDADGLIPNPEEHTAVDVNTHVQPRILSIDNTVWRRQYEFRKQAPEYFQGIKFNMLTRECLNRQPDQTNIEIPEKRREWRKKLALYKKGLRARAKLGAFDSHIQELNASKVAKTTINMGLADSGKDWSDSWVGDNRLNLLHRSMENVDYPQELLIEIVKSCITHYWYEYQSVDSKHIDWEIDRIFKQASTHLRRKFGVFEQEDK